MHVFAPVTLLWIPFPYCLQRRLASILLAQSCCCSRAAVSSQLVSLRVNLLLSPHVLPGPAFAILCLWVEKAKCERLHVIPSAAWGTLCGFRKVPQSFLSALWGSQCRAYHLWARVLLWLSKKTISKNAGNGTGVGFFFLICGNRAAFLLCCRAQVLAVSAGQGAGVRRPSSCWNPAYSTGGTTFLCKALLWL